MKGRSLIKVLSAVMALLVVSGNVPVKPVADLFGGIAITANAEEQGTQTVNFTIAGSITNIDYYVYVGNSTSALEKPDQVAVEGGSKVKIDVAFDQGFIPTLTAECTVNNSVDVTASTDTGNRIFTYEFTMPGTGNVNVQIQMNPVYSTLTVPETEHGSVTVRSPKDNYPTGEKIYLDIIPDSGYTIRSSEYSYNEGSSRYTRQIQNDDSGYYIVMPPADTTVDVQFSAIRAVNIANDENGRVEVIRPLPVESICEDTYVYLKAFPAEGYKIKKLFVFSSQGDIDVFKNGEQENEFYFLMPDCDVDVFPKFVTSKTVTIAESENGTVELKNDSYIVDVGDRVLLEVKPAEGYALSDLWLSSDYHPHVTDIDENGYYFFEMPEQDVEVHAEFAESKTVTVDFGAGHNDFANAFIEVKGYTVNGTTISYPVPKDNFTVGEVERDFSVRVRHMNFDDLTDADGKKFMKEIRLYTSYQTEELYESELDSNVSAEGLTFKAMWAEPVSELTITAPEYKCGQQLTVQYQSGVKRYEPCEVQVSEGVTQCDNYLRFTNWIMENGETVLQGGRNYHIYGYLEADYNKYLTDNVKINVEGGELVSFDADLNRFEISVPVEHDLGESGECSGCAMTSRLEGYSVSLAGDIGVNFYMELDAGVIANSDTAYMQFTIPSGSDTETKTVLVKDAVQKELGGKTYHVFKCDISAKEMASDIKAQIIDGDRKGTEYTYSVKDYADYLLAHAEDNEEYEKAAPLVKAMLNYGTVSQAYFGIGGTAANAGLDDDDKELGNVTIPEKFKYNDANTTLPTDVTFEGATLSLKSETTLSLYFKGLPEDTVFTCGGKEVETANISNKYVVARIRGIKANELENDFTVTFDGGSVTYNAITYCYNVLNSGSDDENLQNVCKALYQYAEAAKAYFG